ncbi:MAG: mercuric reductase [Longimicrobiales bacterium]
MTAENERYDAVVIGAGQGGVPLARAFAEAGRRTVLIERDHVGGTCVNVGCTPTKTMVTSARVAHLARRASDYGVSAGDVTVDLARVVERKDAVVRSFRDGSERRLLDAGVELLCGDARFTGPREIDVRLTGGETRHVASDIVVLDVGGRPSAPPVPGLDAIAWLDSSSIMELRELPQHLLVLGGGYVGLEFAQMFRRFGSDVTIAERRPRPLLHEDADVAAAVTDILCDDGIEVLLSAQALAVEGAAGGGARLQLRTPDGETSRTGSHVLVATGRVPNTDGLGLAAAGVETDDRGFIRVNERLETSAPGVYALGDATGAPQFTHISYDDYRVLRANLLDGGRASVAGRLVPYTVYIDPQLGRVGMSETQAREAGRDIRVAKLPMANVARAIETDETRGFIKAVVDAKTDLILGCAVLGAEGGELMSTLEVAMIAGLPYTMLRDGIFAHPTFAEALNNLFADAAFEAA